jgi:hypothetical protein
LHEGAGSEIGDDGRLLHAALHSVARG